MEEIDRNMIEPPIGEVDFLGTKEKLSNSLRQFHIKIEDLLIKKGIVLLFVGFLLGRALILAQLTPFALPFFSAVYVVRRDRAPLASIGLIGGAATISITHAAYTSLLIFLFLIIFRTTKKWMQNDWKTLPYYVFTILLIGKLTLRFLLASDLTLYDGMMASVEASLGFILTLIFIQSLPLLSMTRRKQSLKTEEIVCLIIMLASVMTGTIGWQLSGLSIEHIMSRYLVLVFALVAGATVGSTVGVVTGLIFSLANISSFFHMSLLAFSGLLGGLLKEGKKVGVSIGLIVATLLIGMYGESGSSLSQTMYESSIAILLLLLTPYSLTGKIAKHIPGTTEYYLEQQQYMRKVRDVTAQRVAKFSSVFQALSHSFSQFDQLNDLDDPEREMDFFLSNVTEKTCQTCHKKEYCWTKNFTTTYDFMSEIMLHKEKEDGKLPQSIAREWRKYCIRSDKVIDAVQQELTFYKANKKLKKQVQESRRLVADQLLGVSEVMGDFAEEIQKEREVHYKQEEQIFEALQDFGIHIEQVEIYSLEQGSVDIDMTIPYCHGHGECEKLIAPMLSNILEETIIVQKEECSHYSNGFCHATFRSAKTFVVETGVAHAAKGGGFVSGDSYSMIELGTGKYAIAISDGMGNGERAYYESNETLQLLQKILQSGIEEKVAIKSINSILSLRTTDEIFSTLDLAMIDLQDANVKFLKIGSIPSFIRRGEKVLKIEANNLPIGILQEFDVEVVHYQLKAGDLLIMMSDGVFEGPHDVENNDLWIKRKIRELETDKPQEIADLIMEEVIRSRAGEIQDDMTVVVAKLTHNTPKWAPIQMNISRKKVSN